MKHLLLALLCTFPLSALASHPHDRVCVGSATIPGQDPVSFVLQWELGRTYEQGDPNRDSHELSVETTSCYGDYSDAECSRSESGKVIIAGTDKSMSAPVTLKNAKGEVFFTGKLSWAKKETLTGRISKGPGMNPNDRDGMAEVTVTLSCVSQPRLKLEQATD